MTNHGSSVAKAEVNVFMAVDIDESTAMSLLNEQRKRTGPTRHPRHRHTRHKVIVCATGHHLGCLMLSLEPLTLSSHDLVQSATNIHASSLAEAARDFGSLD